MYLKTPKRYTAKGSKRSLISFRWLWLYLLAPVILIPAILAWDFRDQLSSGIGQQISRLGIGKPGLPTITPRPTLAEDPAKALQSAFETGKINKAITILTTLGDLAPNEVGVHSLVTQLLVLRSYSENLQMLTDAETAGQQAINANP